MALKIIKVNISLEVKADPNDEVYVREQVYEALQTAMEYEELEYNLEDDDSEELDMEEL